MPSVSKIHRSRMSSYDEILEYLGAYKFTVWHPRVCVKNTSSYDKILSYYIVLYANVYVPAATL